MFDWKTTYKNQSVEVWIVRQQKSVKVTRKVYITDTGSAYVKYDSCWLAVRYAGTRWYGGHD